MTKNVGRVATVSDAPSLHQPWPDSLPGQVVIASVVAVIYLLGYLGHPMLPGNNPAYPLGWWGWCDQGQYLKCTAAIATGHLNASSYWYPIGYPLLGSITWGLAPQHAFFLPDLLCTIGLTLIFYRILRRLLGPAETLLFVAAFVFFYRGVLFICLVEPWNTIPTHCFAYGCCLLLVFSPATMSRIVAASLLIGCTYLCRQGDAVCLLPMLVAAVIALKTRRERLTASVASAGIILVFVAGVLVLNYSIFGSVWTNYDRVLRKIGLGSYPWSWKLHLLFADGTPVFRESEPMLLSHFPWLLCCLPGAIVLTRRLGSRAVAMLISIGATYALYFAYNDFWPSNIFRFQLIHYLVWTLPLLALIAYLGFREGWKTPGLKWSWLSVPALAVMFFLPQLYEKPLTSLDPGSRSSVEIGEHGAARPDWVVFKGTSELPQLATAGKELSSRRDYVDIPRDDGVAVLFAPHVVMPVSAALHGLRMTGVQTGKLRWHWHLAPGGLGLAWFRYFGSVRLVVAGKTGEYDEVGPDGVPDGKPDEVFDVYLPGPVIDEIKTWDLQTNDGMARWLSVPSPKKLWVMKVLRRAPGCARLLIPETGQLPSNTAFTLIGRNAAANICLRTTGRTP